MKSSRGELLKHYIRCERKAHSWPLCHYARLMEALQERRLTPRPHAVNLNGTSSVATETANTRRKHLTNPCPQPLQGTTTSAGNDQPPVSGHPAHSMIRPGHGVSRSPRSRRAHRTACKTYRAVVEYYHLSHARDSGETTRHERDQPPGNSHLQRLGSRS